jgi:hypothetical protein
MFESKMKTILLTLFALVPCLTLGTNQIREKIIYNGATNTLFSFPLNETLAQKALRGNHTRSSACWRGYVGMWKIRDNTLYLVRLQDVNKNDIPADNLIDDASYPLKADWFTGELRIGTGQRRVNTSSTEVFLTVTTGVVSADPEVIDREAEEDAFENELANMKDSSNQLEKDLYEYIYHYYGPWKYNLKFDGLLEVTSDDVEEVKFPYCRTFNRSEEPSAHIRSYIRFLPTSEPRLYKAESVYRKLNSHNSIHYVGFFKDIAFSFSGHPHERLSFENKDGQLRSIKTTDPVKADNEAFETMLRFRKMLEGNTIIPNEIAFNVSIALSTNVLSTNDPMTVDLTVSNSGSESISLCAYDLDVEFLLEDADGTDIAELGRSDWIVRNVTFPVILKAGESKSFGQIQTKVRNGSWTDFSKLPKGPFPTYEGVGLEVKDAVLESGYLLETIPGDYFSSVQIRIRRDDVAELKFVSEKQKIHIN